jgi:hypothetical protein
MTIIAAPEERVTALAAAGRVRSTRRAAVPTGAVTGPSQDGIDKGESGCAQTR